MSRRFEDSFVVGSFDTDALGEMRPNALVRRLQEAADGHARQHGLAVDQLLATGRTWVLREFHVRVLRAARFQEVCRVTTWATGRSAGLRAWRDYVLESQSGERLAVATSMWLMLDTSRWKLIRLPQEVLTMVDPEPESTLEALELGKGVADGPHPVEVEVHWLDLDFNGHVNNVRYLDWLLAVIPDTQWSEQRLVAMGIDFQAEARPGERLLVLGAKAAQEPEPQGKVLGEVQYGANVPSGAEVQYGEIRHNSGRTLVRAKSWWEPRA